MCVKYYTIVASVLDSSYTLTFPQPSQKRCLFPSPEFNQRRHPLSSIVAVVVSPVVQALDKEDRSKKLSLQQKYQSYCNQKILSQLHVFHRYIVLYRDDLVISYEGNMMKKEERTSAI